MSLLNQYNNLLKCINEDISAGIITKDDKLKVIRKKKRIRTEYNPIIDYYYSNNSLAMGYDEMLVSDVLKEIMVELVNYSVIELPSLRRSGSTGGSGKTGHSCLQRNSTNDTEVSPVV